MKIVYCHLSHSIPGHLVTSQSTYSFDSVPDYFWTSVKQTRHFHKGEIVAILPRKDIEANTERIAEFNIKAVACEPLQYSHSFYNLLNTSKSTFPTHVGDTFWLTTFFRLIVVAEWIKQEDAKNVLHIEYDNLIYGNPDLLGLNLNTATGERGLAFTTVGPSLASAGIIYFRDWNAADLLISYFEKLIYKGEEECRKYVRGYDFITEMIMLDLMLQYDPMIFLLPTTPMDNNIETVGNCLFDGASWGQYLGGSNNGHPPGKTAAFQHHWIGQKILVDELDAVFGEDKKPWVKHHGDGYPLFNLHIHNKPMMSKFVSYD